MQSDKKDKCIQRNPVIKSALFIQGNRRVIPYTDQDLIMGAGAFEQVMRSQTAIPGTTTRMSPHIAVGILSAAMRSGLPAARMEEMIEAEFTTSAQLLKQMLHMYAGCDWDIHLWNALPNGRYKLCTDLVRPQLTTWRYDVNGDSLD